MKITTLGKTIAGISLATLVLSACSGNAGTSVTTGTSADVTATEQPAASPQTYAAPTASPVVSAQTETSMTLDATTKKPALSSKDDATSINADLQNTTVSDESFN